MFRAPRGYLRAAYGQPAAVAYYAGRSWVARPMTDFRPDQPGPHGRWKVPGHEVTADTYEGAFAALGFPRDLDLDRPGTCSAIAIRSRSRRSTVGNR